MSWWRLPLEATVKGATITLGSTVLSCALAIQVEKNTNRLFFYFAPHWYANVDYAYGISEAQLASVRHLRRPSPVAVEAFVDPGELKCASSESRHEDGNFPHHEFSLNTVCGPTPQQNLSLSGKPSDGHDRIPSVPIWNTVSPLAWVPHVPDLPIIPAYPSSLSDVAEPAFPHSTEAEPIAATTKSSKVAVLHLGDVMSHAMTT